MEASEFAKEYTAIFKRAIALAEMTRRKGLLSLKDVLDENKLRKRDVFELGLHLVYDGTNVDIVYNVMTNIINQETDKDKKTLYEIAREAVIAIQSGGNPRLLALVLNSYVSIGIEEAMAIYNAPDPAAGS